MGCRHRNRSELMECKYGYPEQIPSFHEEHHGIALFKTEHAESICSLIAERFHITECEHFPYSARASVDKCSLFRRDTCIFINHVICEIEIFTEGGFNLYDPPGSVLYLFIISFVYFRHIYTVFICNRPF